MPDKQKKQPINGVIWNALGSLMWGAQSFIMLLMVSRFASMEQVGAFGIAFTTAQMLYIVGCFGSSEYQMTDYTKKYPFAVYLRTRLFSGALMLLIGTVACLVLGFSGEKLLYTAALTALMLVNVFGDAYQNLFFQNNRLDLSGSALFYRTAFCVLAFCITLAATRQILLAILIQTGVNLLLTIYYARRVAAPFLVRVPRDRREELGARQLVLDCYPLFISMFLMNLVINMPKYGVEICFDETVQGYLNLIFLPMQVVTLCSQFIFRPYLNRYAVELENPDLSAFYRLLRGHLLILGGFTAICCVGAWFLGAPVLGFVYGKDISAYTVPLTIIVLGGGVFALCNLFYCIYVILREQKTIMGFYLAALACAVVLAAVCIPRGAVTGASLAFLITHLILLCGYICMLPGRLKKKHT